MHARMRAAAVVGTLPAASAVVQCRQAGGGAAYTCLGVVGQPQRAADARPVLLQAGDGLLEGGRAWACATAGGGVSCGGGLHGCSPRQGPAGGKGAGGARRLALVRQQCRRQCAGHPVACAPCRNPGQPARRPAGERQCCGAHGERAPAALRLHEKARRTHNWITEPDGQMCGPKPRRRRPGWRPRLQRWRHRSAMSGGRTRQLFCVDNACIYDKAAWRGRGHAWLCLRPILLFTIAHSLPPAFWLLRVRMTDALTLSACSLVILPGTNHAVRAHTFERDSASGGGGRRLDATRAAQPLAWAGCWLRRCGIGVSLIA